MLLLAAVLGIAALVTLGSIDAGQTDELIADSVALFATKAVMRKTCSSSRLVAQSALRIGCCQIPEGAPAVRLQDC